jgi:hypothetical protein
MLNEARIKAAVIDKLMKRHYADGSVLISEMPVAGYPRRVDLVMANGNLEAFEIKGENDSLARLEGQMSAYVPSFDKVTLVVAPKFVAAVLERYPAGVEVWEARLAQDQSVQLTRRRRVAARAIACRTTLAGYLRKVELIRFLRLQGIQTAAGDARAELLLRLDEVHVTRLRRFVLESIKTRFRASHDAFALTRGDCTLAEDLAALRRNGHRRHSDVKGVAVSSGRTRATDSLDVPAGAPRRAVDGPRLQRRYGVAIETVPPFVLLRSSASAQKLN